MKKQKKESAFRSVKKALHSKKAFFVDTGVLILIAVVIGALTLGGLYAVTNDTILPTVKTKIESMFNYSESVTPQKIKGDLNGDGQLDDADASILQQEIRTFTGNYDIVELDMNDDGNVDVMDLTRIKKMIEAVKEE